MAKGPAQKISRQTASAAGFAGLVMAVAIGFGIDPNEGAPPRSELEKTVGELTWYAGNTKRVRFRLDSDDRLFVYSKLSGKLSEVRKAIREGLGRPVQVLHETEGYRPYFVMEKRFEVRELHIGGKPVRELSDVDAALRRNSASAPWVALLCGAAGIYLLVVAYRLPPSSAA